MREVGESGRTRGALVRQICLTRPRRRSALVVHPFKKKCICLCWAVQALLFHLRQDLPELVIVRGKQNSVFGNGKIGDFDSKRIPDCSAPVAPQALSNLRKEVLIKRKTLVLDSSSSCFSTQKRGLLVEPFQWEQKIINLDTISPLFYIFHNSVITRMFVLVVSLDVWASWGSPVEMLVFANRFISVKVDGFVEVGLCKLRFSGRMGTCPTVRISTILEVDSTEKVLVEVPQRLVKQFSSHASKNKVLFDFRISTPLPLQHQKCRDWQYWRASVRLF